MYVRFERDLKEILRQQHITYYMCWPFTVFDWLVCWVQRFHPLQVFSRRTLSLIEPNDRLDKIKQLKPIIWKEEGKREYDMKQQIG